MISTATPAAWSRSPGYARTGVAIPDGSNRNSQLGKRATRRRWPHTRKDGTEIRRLEDLEIGDMAAQARRFRVLETEQRRLDWLRRVRNALAHNEIVPWGTLVSPVALQIVDFRE